MILFGQEFESDLISNQKQQEKTKIVGETVGLLEIDYLLHHTTSTTAHKVCYKNS